MKTEIKDFLEQIWTLPETCTKDTTFDNVSQYLATIPACQPQRGSQPKLVGQHQCPLCLHAAHRSEALAPHGC